MSQAINITKGNDHRLRVAMTRWSEPMALSSGSNVHAYAVKSLTGVRSALIVRYSSQDEGVMEVDLHRLAQQAFDHLVLSNNWTFAQIDELEGVISGN